VTKPDPVFVPFRYTPMAAVLRSAANLATSVEAYEGRSRRPSADPTGSKVLDEGSEIRLRRRR
jgi:hypothetical protein